jgi:hypothetical protein
LPVLLRFKIRWFSEILKLYLQVSVLRQGGLGISTLKKKNKRGKIKKGKKIQEEEGDEIH